MMVFESLAKCRKEYERREIAANRCPSCGHELGLHEGIDTECYACGKALEIAQ